MVEAYMVAIKKDDIKGWMESINQTILDLQDKVEPDKLENLKMLWTEFEARLGGNEIGSR